jgi:hypothetical protein
VHKPVARRVRLPCFASGGSRHVPRPMTALLWTTIGYRFIERRAHVRGLATGPRSPTCAALIRIGFAVK